MRVKSFILLAILVTTTALAVPSIFAIDKNPGTLEGIPPRTVVD